LREYQRKWRRKNRDKVRVYNRKNYKYDYAKSRAKALRRKFGISLMEYEALRDSQQSRCAICFTDKPGGKGDWHLDHDHVSKKIRGLLCQNCNIGLGSFKDDPRRLEQAADYLRKHVHF
jgi:hypothetical protein